MKSDWWSSKVFFTQSAVEFTPVEYEQPTTFTSWVINSKKRNEIRLVDECNYLAQVAPTDKRVSCIDVDIQCLASHTALEARESHDSVLCYSMFQIPYGKKKAQTKSNYTRKQKHFKVCWNAGQGVSQSQKEKPTISQLNSFRRHSYLGIRLRLFSLFSIFACALMILSKWEITWPHCSWVPSTQNLNDKWKIS